MRLTNSLSISCSLFLLLSPLSLNCFFQNNTPSLAKSLNSQAISVGVQLLLHLSSTLPSIFTLKSFMASHSTPWNSAPCLRRNPCHHHCGGTARCEQTWTGSTSQTHTRWTWRSRRTWGSWGLCLVLNLVSLLLCLLALGLVIFYGKHEQPGDAFAELRDAHHSRDYDLYLLVAVDLWWWWSWWRRWFRWQWLRDKRNEQSSDQWVFA